MKCFVIVPSRYNSTRLPKKSLIKVGKKQETLIEHVYKRCIKSKLADKVYVVTDHEDIANDVYRFSNNVIMSANDLASGTDRVYQGASKLGLSDDDFIINVQGDSAMIEPSLIDDLIKAHKHQENKADILTFAVKITNNAEIENTNDVKVVLNKNNEALYFSRLAIPCNRDKEDKNTICYYKHLGIYGYSYKFLKTYVSLPVSMLESAEKLEQLRALENGYTIKVLHTSKDTIDINSSIDVDRLNKILK